MTVASACLRMTVLHVWMTPAASLLVRGNAGFADMSHGKTMICQDRLGPAPEGKVKYASHGMF
jgi:hypothetical protein